MESGSHIIEDVENNITRIISPSGEIQIFDTPCPMPIRRTVKNKIGASGPLDGNHSSGIIQIYCSHVSFRMASVDNIPAPLERYVHLLPR